MKGFEKIVRDSGWYDLFEQTNGSGEIDFFENVMAHAPSDTSIAERLGASLARHETASLTWSRRRPV